MQMDPLPCLPFPPLPSPHTLLPGVESCLYLVLCAPLSCLEMQASHTAQLFCGDPPSSPLAFGAGEPGWLDLMGASSSEAVQITSS